MLNWLNFFLLLFWLSIFGFLFNPNNFLNLLLYSEISWLILYSLCIILGSYIDDITTTSITFFILGLAGLEFSFAFLLLILFRSLNFNYNFIDNNTNEFTNNLIVKKNTIFNNNFFWLK